MRVDLRSLQPNPMRDFTMDPMDPETVERLRQSIEEDGFWGGVVCRKLPDGTFQIGAGHHRVAAALAAGITEVDLFVAEAMDDAAMIRVYARENATQRGMSSTALTGSVASAVRYIAKGILTGAAREIASSFHLPTLRERLVSEEGIGEPVIASFLHDIAGINTHAIREQLANLKSSGDYARLIAEVQGEIAAEHAAAEAQALARQAAEVAAKQPRIFDFHGVAKHLTNPHQIDVFRELATSEGVRRHLAHQLVAATPEDVLLAVAAEEGIAPEEVEAWLEEEDIPPIDDLTRADIEAAFPARPTPAPLTPHAPRHHAPAPGCGVEHVE